MDMFNSLSREEKETMQKMINMNQEAEKVTSSSTVCESKSFCYLIKVVDKHMYDLSLHFEISSAPGTLNKVPPNLNTHTPKMAHMPETFKETTPTTTALKETIPTLVSLKEATPTTVALKEMTTKPTVFSEMTPLPDALTPSKEVKKEMGSKKCSALNLGCPEKLTFQSFTLNG